MTQTLKNLLVLVVFVILIALGYYMFTQRNAGTLSPLSGSGVSPELLQKTQVFIERRAALSTSELKTEFLTEAPFTTLRSYTTEVPDQTIGRTNIFNPATPVPAVAPVPLP